MIVCGTAVDDSGTIWRKREHTESCAAAVGTETRPEGTFPIIPCFVVWWPFGS